MTYSDYARLCRRFRAEIDGVKIKTQMQQRKAVDLMRLARRMGDFGSSMRIVGCSRDALQLWRIKYNQEPCTGPVANGVRCAAGGRA